MSPPTKKIGFGAFLAPHHPIGEHPTLQLQADLELVAHLDRLGYDEFWCGEHHSTGWEVIASPRTTSWTKPGMSFVVGSPTDERSSR